LCSLSHKKGIVDFTEQIARIKKKLLKAKEVDAQCKVFGASSHKYELNPPTSIAEVEKFEKKHEIRLPECYKFFVLMIGNGGSSFLNSGAGPFFGIYPFGKNTDQLIHNNTGNYLSNKCMLYPDMTDTFWDELIDPLYEDDISDKDYDDLNRKIYGGILPIGSQGCSYIHALVLNGPFKGRVINMDMMGEQMTPRFAFEQNFLDWYERWLDEVISGKLAKTSPTWFGYTNKINP